MKSMVCCLLDKTVQDIVSNSSYIADTSSELNHLERIGITPTCARREKKDYMVH